MRSIELFGTKIAPVIPEHSARVLQIYF
ncbi:hypothetical protein PBAL39_14234 [Pedobacter sp. BAL39]|nr:hypothetical protein PBAL39_14234 [Pedobacter sp. BAL39]